MENNERLPHIPYEMCEKAGGHKYNYRKRLSPESYPMIYYKECKRCGKLRLIDISVKGTGEDG